MSNSEKYLTYSSALKWLYMAAGSTKRHHGLWICSLAKNTKKLPSEWAQRPIDTLTIHEEDEAKPVSQEEENVYQEDT